VTVADQVAAARHALRTAGIPPDEAELDARLLAEHVLGWTTARFLTDAGTARASLAFGEQYHRLVERRARREPFAYLVGRQEFWGRTFNVSPAVLIPRPETELLVEIGLTLTATDSDNASRRISIADVCTGSGCVAVSLACERGTAIVTATDVSDAALAVARQNAVRHGVADRIRLLPADLLAGAGAGFDLIVANPPYVPERDRTTLQAEVRDHEPPIALFAGPDGLDVIRRLAASAPDHLRPRGWLVFEFGFGQADAVAGLISATPGLTMIELRPDLQGIPRVAVARRDGADNGLPLLQDRQP
jgi:release factor glutamine methyltransferase